MTTHILADGATGRVGEVRSVSSLTLSSGGSEGCGVLTRVFVMCTSPPIRVCSSAMEETEGGVLMAGLGGVSALKMLMEAPRRAVVASESSVGAGVHFLSQTSVNNVVREASTTPTKWALRHGGRIHKLLSPDINVAMSRGLNAIVVVGGHSSGTLTSLPLDASLFMTHALFDAIQPLNLPDGLRPIGVAALPDGRIRLFGGRRTSAPAPVFGGATTSMEVHETVCNWVVHADAADEEGEEEARVSELSRVFCALVRGGW